MKKLVLFVGILVAITMCLSTTKAATEEEIKQAIADGLEWLAGEQNTTPGPNFGSWGTQDRVARTGLAVKKFEHHAIDQGINPLDPAYQYYDQVKHGLNFLFSKAATMPITSVGQAGDPDSDGDGVGVYFVSVGGFYRSYETGIALMAIAESNCPDSVVDVADPPGSVLNGETYYDVADNVVDYLTFGQNEGLGNEQGGWGYYENCSGWSDNSCSGYATLGLAFAAAAGSYGFGIPIPQFVKDELEIWIDYIQCDNTDPNHTASTDGGSGYSNAYPYPPGPCSWVNTLKTGNLLFEMSLIGETSGARKDRAIAYLVRHWYDNNNDPGWQNEYQAMYCIMKGLEFQGIQTIDGIDWYFDLADHIVATQNQADGSWGPCRYGDYILCTEWALLTLEKAAPPPEGGTVIIPNQVYQRYGFDYCYVHDWEDDSVVLHDKCPEYIEGAAHPGDFISIPIVLDGFAGRPIGAFEFEVEFDYIYLTFYGAERGDLLWAVWEEPYEEDPSQMVLWSWEYFSYRLCPCTVPACQKYKILVYGQAEMPDGLLRRGYCIDLPNLHPEIEAVDTLNVPLFDLVWFNFQIANNELLRDTKLPVKFEWEAKIEDGVVVDDWDCAENTISDCEGTILYVSNDSLQFGDVCFDEFQYPPEQILTFIDGGIHICSPCSGFKCVRGDINLDHIPNSAADAVMLARAIVHGTYEIFTLDYDAQLCASDINADGRPAMLADLIYLIRVIQRDAVPYPKLGPSSEVANVILSDGLISVECGAEIGGLLFEFDGAVIPTLLATHMDLIAHEGKVLVWSSDGNSMTSGEVLSAVGAELVSVTAVDRDGRDLATTITAKVAPSAFALHPAYPNPFNPYTNLSFTLPAASAYTMKIYNVAGQMVRSYEGMGAAGLNVITWDGKNNVGNDVASGLYFYKLVAGQHSAIKRMVVLK